MRNLIFVHGRSQEKQDAAVLKATWIEWLYKGFQKANLHGQLDGEKIRFPYYGNTLFGMMDPPAENVPKVIVKGVALGSTANEKFSASIVMDVSRALGLSDAQISQYDEGDVHERGAGDKGWVRAALKAISACGGSTPTISFFTHDVYRYLRNAGVRDEIGTGVLKAFIPGEPTVVVSHSLGTIVAYNVLRREGQQRGWDVTQFVTLGSPLAIPTVKKALYPLQFPSCAHQQWFNAHDLRDIVALYPLVPPSFPLQPIRDKGDVDNFTDNRHGIEGYLSDPEVAKCVYDALF